MIAVLGGYGTFGSIVARELARAQIPVTIIGRDGAHAETFAHSLRQISPLPHCGVCADAGNSSALRAVIADMRVLVNCAGPYSSMSNEVLDSCIEVGCHHVDISDDRGFAALVRSYSDRFRARGLVAAYGCSSLPSISGALALLARADSKEPIERVRVTLIIGNDNPKGRAAIQSAVAMLGRPFPAPQGTIKGFNDGELIPLPEPFGPRYGYNFESPEYDLFPQLLDARAVVVKIAFELRAATATFALLARLSAGYGERTAAVLNTIGRLSPAVGCSGGAVMTELFGTNGTVRRATLLAKEQGQLMAALPAVIAARALYQGADARGALTAYELVGARALIDAIVAERFHLITESED